LSNAIVRDGALTGSWFAEILPLGSWRWFTGILLICGDLTEILLSLFAADMSSPCDGTYSPEITDILNVSTKFVVRWSRFDVTAVG
jgi:hypothetical protein